MTRFQERIKKILNSDFEFSNEENKLIRKIWRTEEEVVNEISRAYYARIHVHEDEDPLYKEWRRIYNNMNVTLNKTKKDGKDRSAYIKTCLSRLENVYNQGYDPYWHKKGPINWEESFKKGEVIYWKKEETTE